MKNIKIEKGLKKINEICEKLQEQKTRFTSLNILSDYKIILNDERVKNKEIINSILNELKEYDNKEVVDYYELETYLSIMKEYRKEFNLF